MSHQALIAGAWLQPGQHVDLVGAFNMQMREVDDIALKRARVFVDTPAALTEGGDVALGLQSGAIAKSDIVADLPALANGAPGRGRRQGDHLVQVGRRRDRGPRRGDAGL